MLSVLRQPDLPKEGAGVAAYPILPILEPSVPAFQLKERSRARACCTCRIQVAQEKVDEVDESKGEVKNIQQSRK